VEYYNKKPEQQQPVEAPKDPPEQGGCLPPMLPPAWFRSIGRLLGHDYRQLEAEVAEWENKQAGHTEHGSASMSAADCIPQRPPHSQPNA
jgi:hypothetical protein